MKYLISFFCWSLVFVSCTQTKEQDIISEEQELVRLAGNFSFTEGPTADKMGNVYFTDQPNNKIYKYGVSTGLSEFMEEAGRANGLYYDHNDQLWICADEKNQLRRYSFQEDTTYLMASLKKDSSFNGPNDVWVHTNGQVYFTDPLYQRPYWQEAHDTLAFQGLYMLAKNGELTLLDSLLVQPNGIVGDSKKNQLYVADIGDGKTYRYTIGQDGVLKDKTLFIGKGSDGMTLDNKGNLYITGEGVDVYNPNGKLIKHIEVPENWTANICFGGTENNELFITASKGLYSIKTLVEGVK